MIWNWFAARKELQARIEAEAQGMMAAYGSRAMGLAREKMIETTKSGDSAGNAYWSRVYRVIKTARTRGVGAGE